MLLDKRKEKFYTHLFLDNVYEKTKNDLKI